jgi:ubiquinol-cytochrome c reductase cytochrome b subunit
MLMRLLTDLMGWVDKRLPVTDAWNKHIAQYPAPKKL